MPDPDEWCREVDESLFDNGPAESRRHPADDADDVGDFLLPPDARPQRDMPIAAVDTALFGGTGPSASTATEVQAPAAPPDIAIRIAPEYALPEEMPTAPTVLPMIFDEEGPVLVDPDSSDDDGEPTSTTKEHGRRRVWAVAVIALAVVVGTGLGAVALTRSGDSPPAVHTDSESTTATTSTTTPATTTSATTTPATTPPPAPLTAAPAASAPPPAPTPRPVPTTTPRSARVPGPAPTEPAPPAPPPPPPPPPSSEPPAPSTSPPTSPPPSTLLPSAT